MNTLSAFAPSAGLWRRTGDLKWTGWNQYVVSMNNDVSLQPRFLARNRGTNNVGAESQAAVEQPQFDRAA